MPIFDEGWGARGDHEAAVLKGRGANRTTSRSGEVVILEKGQKRRRGVFVETTE